MNAKKKNLDTDSLFQKSTETQGILFDKDRLDTGTKNKMPYIPLGFRQEMEMLQNYIENLRKDQKDLLKSEKLLFHFTKKMRELQNIHSQEFWLFCEDLGASGEKIKKTLKLKAPQPPQKPHPGQMTVEDIIAESEKK